MDNDGDIDIVTQSSWEFLSWENPGNNINISEWNTYSSDSVCGSLEDIHSADLDNDGDIDLMTGGQASCIFVLENPGGSIDLTTWTSNNISNANPRAVFTGDVDNDGDSDIISGTGGSGSNVFIFENSDVSSTYITSDVRTFINQSGNATTYSLNWTPGTEGNYTLMAIADNTGAHAEVLENNNRIVLNMTAGSIASEFDLRNVSLANNNSYLFAKMMINDNFSFSNASKFYRLFISTDDSVGNQTTPENEDLPF